MLTLGFKSLYSIFYWASSHPLPLDQILAAQKGRSCPSQMSDIYTRHVAGI